MIVAGINKMVGNIDEAVMRNKAIAESANARLLNRKTPCTKMVKCCTVRVRSVFVVIMTLWECI